MITISLCMIVKNEEQVLGRCLDSVKNVVDELIIMDTGSADKTKEIASRYTEHVYDFAWTEDFAAARNAAFEKATMDYQMWLDADDVILPDQAEKMKELKDELILDTDMVVMKYDTSFDSAGNVLLTSKRERLMKRVNGYKWEGEVHECIPLSGNIRYSDIRITHKKEDYERTSDRNLKIYEKSEAEGKLKSPRQMYYYARELKEHRLFERAVKYYQMFLDTNLGWAEDNIWACFDLAYCLKSINKNALTLPILTRSFQYDSPRAEICTAIGYYYKEHNDYEKAIRWFGIAANLSDEAVMGFKLQDYWGYIPNLEICVCYYKLGNIEKAVSYNQLAKKYKPESEAVKYNEEFFAKLRETEV